MLPYPSSHHLISQEATPPNPTFPMPLDQHYEQLFSGHQFSSGTLEAVLRPPAVAREATAAVAAMATAVARNGRGGARKRPFRTDRHSKIRTAQGVRDRRMRLSLDVARDFFALQDRLGFDKASKTVNWLLTQSKPAIDRLSASPHREGCGDLPATELAGRPVNEVGGAGSGKREVDEVKVRGRSDGSVLVEHGCELDRLVSAATEAAALDQPMEYYYDYDLGELMSNNGGEGDDDGNDDEGDDFLDGMQY